MSDDNGSPPGLVGAELVTGGDPDRLAHLAQNRPFIIRRSLLATALGGFIPLPVMDDLISGRVRAGLYMRLAETRQVDLPQTAADLLADPRDTSTLRNATLLAATLIAIKLAWRKFFALLAAGRGAEEMATTFQFASLVDHYCAKLHVGGGVSRSQASELRKVILVAIERTEKVVLVSVFREGGKVLGRSILEAPRWVSDRLSGHAERWVQTGGRPDAPFGSAVNPGTPEAAWLERAARAVEARLASVGTEYVAKLVDRFEEAWRQRPPLPPPTPTARSDNGHGTD